jgi:threonine/homoserine/homoserine lactone efflux protein
MSGFELLIVLAAWGIGAGSPGPATLTIASTAMDRGRRDGMLTGLGVLAGSSFWGLAAMFGMSALMLSNGWIVEVLRYLGAGYLLYLALKSLRSAITAAPLIATGGRTGLPPFLKGLFVHLTNPKPIFGWGAVFAVLVPPGSDFTALITIYLSLVSVSAAIFIGYGALFAAGGVMRVYQRMKRGFELVFAALFGAAALKILTTRLT